MPDTDVVASLAVTLDGYIARTDGSFDYLDKYPIEDFDFTGFTDTIGALIMGRDTYEVTAGLGWMWHDKPTLVLTNQSELDVPEGADVRFAAMPAAEAIPKFSAETPGRLWVFGGARVIADGLKAGVIDTLDLMVMPEALGEGIPLFPEPYDRPMKLVEARGYANAAVRLIYDLRA